MSSVYLFVLQCILFSFSQPSPYEARDTISATSSLSEGSQTPRVFRRTASSAQPQPPASDGFNVEYTLITVNSPDCESTPIDKFPVRVQYRDTSPGITPGEWRDPANASMPGQECAFTNCCILKEVKSMFIVLMQSVNLALIALTTYVCK